MPIARPIGGRVSGGGAVTETDLNDKVSGEKDSVRRDLSETESGQKDAGEQAPGEQPSEEQASGEKDSGQQDLSEKDSGETDLDEEGPGEQASGEKDSDEKDSGQQDLGEKDSGETDLDEEGPGEQASGEKDPGEKERSEAASGPTPPSPPRATMRLQFHKGFTFDDAARQVEYLDALHVSHLYASPILSARPGSMHGYDVFDPTKVNPELGGEEGYRRLVAALRRLGLGIIVDIVPNHMAVIGADNVWWRDVLQNGQASAYAKYFDIDWAPADETLRGKVLLPFLGRPYGEALREGEISVGHDAAGDRYEARYFDHAFPLSPKCRQALEQLGLDAFNAPNREAHARLHALLEAQHYRLAWWQSANDAINWRRFFEINELAALRVEDEEVFEATHATLFRLFAEGLIDGFRVDHIDGLADPRGYCRRLRGRLDELAERRPQGAPRRPYIVVEKILATGERLPQDWGCDGTSGYDFMNEAASVLHDPAGEAALNMLWASVSGRSAHFVDEEERSRREMLERAFAGQFDAAVAVLHRLSHAEIAARDVGAPALRRALAEILVHLRAYRTYGDPQIDHSILDAAVAGAKRTCLRRDRAVVERLAAWLGGGKAAAGAEALQTEAVRRFQQLSAPLAAKAVEDTAFYRYGRLLSRLDVGFDAARLAISVPEFHEACAARLRQFPDTMLATATHDHKRGEDVRARLAVLSELATEWASKARHWIEASAPLRHRFENGLAPTRADIAILLQTIVGAWPLALGVDDAEGLAEFASRVADWQLKALREAKLATDWVSPDEAYEAAAHGFVTGLFAGEPPGLLADIASFAQRIAPAGAVNGLTQTLLKLTTPGVPDTYQGAEFWDFSLVDPDNRRPVDFDVRREALSRQAPMAELAGDWRSARIKQAVIRSALALRHRRPELFARGDYAPLTVEGPQADHLIAFSRRLGDAFAVVIVCRLPSRLVEAEGIVVPSDAWNGTCVRLPPQMVNASVRDALTDEECAFAVPEVPVATILNWLPAALLTNV
jgi:malto-oligosyltrehalose synthase